MVSYALYLTLDNIIDSLNKNRRPLNKGYNGILFIPGVSSLQSSVLGVHNNPDETLPKLMNNLIDEDPMVVQETLVFVEKLAKKDTFLNAMIRNLDFVGAVIQSLVIAMTNLSQAANALAAANNANESGNLFEIKSNEPFFQDYISYSVIILFK